MPLGFSKSAPAEASALAELPGPARREAFFRYWTLKEAYIKACGMGLSMPLQRFAFRLGSGRTPAIWFADPAGDRPEDWQFAEFPLRGRYQVAVAVRCPRLKALEIVVREMSFGSRSGAEPCG